MPQMRMTPAVQTGFRKGQEYLAQFNEAGLRWNDALAETGLPINVADVGRGVSCFALMSMIRQMDEGQEPDPNAAIDDVCRQLTEDPEAPKRLVGQYYEFMAATDPSALNPDNPQDVWAVFSVEIPSSRERFRDCVSGCLLREAA